jgi:hypothetical protein
MNDPLSYLGTIIENKNFRLSSRVDGKLVVQIIGFREPEQTFILRVIETGEWQRGLGFTLGRVLETTRIFDDTTGREWWNLKGDLPWISLEFNPEPSFEHYR